MEEPKVQIIIPVYNAQKYLSRCLDSVKSQTYTNWEAILVNDASTDNSVEIMSNYAISDKRFVCITQAENGGASKARNTALSHLDSEYTAFLDADDYWEPEMLSNMVSKAVANNSDVVQCRYIYDYVSGKQILPKGAFDRDVTLQGNALKTVYIKFMTGINMNHVCMKLIRTELLRDLSFDLKLRTAEDLQFCIKLFQKVKAYDFINKPFYHYCRNEDSLTGKGLPFKVKLSSNRSVSRDLVNALPSWGMNTFYYRLLSLMRPYIITISKIWRILCEKFFSKN